MARGNSFEDLARDAADRIDHVRAQGEQLALLPGMDAATDADGAPAVRGKGKAQSQLRDWLATKGYRMPEDVLAEMAGLATSDDAFTSAMVRAEQLMTWAYAGAKGKDKDGKTVKLVPTPSQRIAAFQLAYTTALRAVDALMPYGAAKVQPDVQVHQATTIVMPTPTAAPGDHAKVVSGRRMAPPPMPHEMQQNQDVSDMASDDAVGARRTDQENRAKTNG
ncbi:MAG: hypothetical protein AAFY65_01300 [Pseudomonadota bacterium]